MANLQSISDRLKFGRRIHAFVKWSLRMLLFDYQGKTFDIMYYTAFVTTLEA